VGAGRCVAYAQAGAGLAYGEFNDAKPASRGQVIRGKGMHPALRADLGAEYFLISNFSVNADLRYLYTWGHDFRVNESRFRDTDFSAFQIQIGFRIYFNRPPAS
jgi:opacity protein-like surface antigen